MIKIGNRNLDTAITPQGSLSLYQTHLDVRQDPSCDSYQAVTSEMTIAQHSIPVPWARIDSCHPSCQHPDV